MPYTIKHAQSGTLLAGFQLNGYDLKYYGIFLWEREPDAEQMTEAMAKSGVDPANEAFRLEHWEPLELSEHEAKMANVKLRNDPRRVAYHRNGSIDAAFASP